MALKLVASSFGMKTCGLQSTKNCISDLNLPMSPAVRATGYRNNSSWYVQKSFSGQQRAQAPCTDLSCLMQESMDDFQLAQMSLNVAISFLSSFLARASTTSKSTSVQSCCSLFVCFPSSERHARPRSMCAADREVATWKMADTTCRYRCLINGQHATDFAGGSDG